jgi:hypothetical protein
MQLEWEASSQIQLAALQLVVYQQIYARLDCQIEYWIFAMVQGMIDYTGESSSEIRIWDVNQDSSRVLSDKGLLADAGDRGSRRNGGSDASRDDT